ncbi:MAG: hypothetical protein AB4041_05870 [Microcystaceae cyanobacterium]
MAIGTLLGGVATNNIILVKLARKATKAKTVPMPIHVNNLLLLGGVFNVMIF